MSGETTSKRIPIAFTTEDYDLLYSVQQAYLYSGRSLNSLWQLSDILKAMVLNAGIDLTGRNVSFLRARLEPFLKNHGLALSNLPANRNEFFSTLVDYLSSMGRRNLADSANKVITEARIPNIEEIFKGEPRYYKIPGDISSSEKTSNFILTLTSEELELFDIIRYSIQAYVRTEISYSEMVRTLFRSTVEIERGDSERKASRWNFLASIYLGSLYNFSPQDSILISSRSDGLYGVTIGKGALDSLKWIDRDEVILDRYKDDLDNQLNQEARDAQKKKGKTGDEPGYGLTNINKNREREDRFRSAVSNFGFHSAFIGYSLLFFEWEFDQHKLPLLAAYLRGDVPVNGGNRQGKTTQIGHIFSQVAFNQLFVPRLKMLYESSGIFRNEGKLSNDSNIST
jgi:hypothetical protein